MPDFQLLTVRETSELLRLSERDTRRLINGKLPNLPTLPSVRIGRRVMVERITLLGWTLSLAHDLFNLPN